MFILKAKGRVFCDVCGSPRLRTVCVKYKVGFVENCAQAEIVARARIRKKYICKVCKSIKESVDAKTKNKRNA